MGSNTTSASQSPALVWLKIIGSILGLGLGYLAIVGICASFISDPVAAMVIANIIVFALYLLWHYVRPERTSSQNWPHARCNGRLGRQQWLQLGAVVVMLWIAGQIIAMTLYSLVGSETFAANAQDQRGSQLWSVILLLMAAPLAEEALIRGSILPRLRTGLGVVAASIVSALLFSLLHLNLVQIVLTLPLGIVLGFVACYTGRIRETIALHAGFNLLSVIVPAGMIVPFAHIISAVPALAVCAFCVVLGRRALA